MSKLPSEKQKVRLGISAESDKIADKVERQAVEGDFVHAVASGSTGTSTYGNGSEGRQFREQINWGEQYWPQIDSKKKWETFRRICDAILSEVNELRQFVKDGQVSVEGSGCQAEISRYLQELYQLEWCEEALQNVVVCVEFQINNIDWRQEHVEFLNSVFKYIRARYVISDTVVDECYELAKQHGLDVFAALLPSR